MESVAAETTAAAEATAITAAKLASLDATAQTPPGSTRCCSSSFRSPQPLSRSQRPGTRPDHAGVRAVREWGRQQAAVWDSFVAVLEAEYLPAVNPHIRDRFEGTLPPRDGDPADYHRQFRLGPRC